MPRSTSPVACQINSRILAEWCDFYFFLLNPSPIFLRTHSIHHCTMSHSTVHVSGISPATSEKEVRDFFSFWYAQAASIDLTHANAEQRQDCHSLHHTRLRRGRRQQVRNCDFRKGSVSYPAVPSAHWTKAHSHLAPLRPPSSSTRPNSALPPCTSKPPPTSTT